MYSNNQKVITRSRNLSHGKTSTTKRQLTFISLIKLVFTLLKTSQGPLRCPRFLSLRRPDVYSWVLISVSLKGVRESSHREETYK